MGSTSTVASSCAFMSPPPSGSGLSLYPDTCFMRRLISIEPDRKSGLKCEDADTSRHVEVSALSA